MPTGPAIPLLRRPLLARALLVSACAGESAAHASGLDYYFLSLVFVLVNLITDLVYARVDPRVSYD